MSGNLPPKPSIAFVVFLVICILLEITKLKYVVNGEIRLDGYKKYVIYVLKYNTSYRIYISWHKNKNKIRSVLGKYYISRTQEHF